MMTKTKMMTKKRHALIAALSASALLCAGAPAAAGPLGFLKDVAKKELKKEAAKKLGIREEAAGNAQQNAALDEGAGNEGSSLLNVLGTVALAKLTQNGTTVETASEVQAGNAGLAADAEPQDAFLYFGPRMETRGWDNVKNKKWDNAAAQAADHGHDDWIIIQSLTPDQYNGGVFLASGDVNGDGRDDIIVGPGMCALVQNGTTVATAEDILTSLSGEEQALWRQAKANHNMTASCAKLVQNGTTVATASEIQAQHGSEPIGLLLPAVQKFRAAARPARAGMSQNGTTVPSADTVQAPGEGPQRSNFALLLGGPSSEPEKNGTSQNGTTVPSADTITAPEPEARASSKAYIKLGDIKGD